MGKISFYLLILAMLTGCWDKSVPPQKNAKKEQVRQQENLAKKAQEWIALENEKDAVELKPGFPTAVSYEVKIKKSAKGLQNEIENYYASHPSCRGYIQTDKPIYQPGETIWIKTSNAITKTFSTQGVGYSAHYRFLSPRGNPVVEKNVRVKDGCAFCDIDLSEEIAGGEYTIEVSYDGAKVAERKVTISTYQPPRLKKKLEFLRKAYGPGDAGQATLQVHRATGEMLANHPFTVVVSIEGNEIKRFALRTDAKGEAMIDFQLPDKIEKEDGSLNVLVEDGGITESIARPIPIVLSKMNLAIYPEGGNLVADLPSRVYFYATNMIGKPADMEAALVSEKGEVVEKFASYHRGMGYFTVTPQVDKEYFLKVLKPIGIKTLFKLPSPHPQGIVLKITGQESGNLKLSLFSKEESKKVFVSAMVRENVVGILAVNLQEGENEVLLPLRHNLQGIARVTVFDEELLPLAERLVYLGRSQDMTVQITPRQNKYHPRDQVELDIQTKTLDGKATQANLCLSVVDDTVLSFADDKTAHILATLYLQSEIASPIEEPNFYFSQDEKAPQALDMLLASLGWRTFEWQNILSPMPPIPIVEMVESAKDAIAKNEIEEKQMVEVERPAKEKGEVNRKVREMAQKLPASPAPKKDLRRQVVLQEKAKIAAGKPIIHQKILAADHEQEMLLPEDRDIEDIDVRLAPLALVRKFAVPIYEKGYDGPRNDFRETIFWEPEILTDDQGKATVTFSLSDAITTFRAICEGISGNGMVGRSETLIQSKLPFYMTVKIPSQVSAQDVIYLPLTLANEQDTSLAVNLTHQFSPLFQLMENVAPAVIKLEAGEKKSFLYPLQVIGKSGKGEMYFKAQGLGLKDEFTSEIAVAPRGFPKQFSFSGTLDKEVVHTISIPKEVVEGSLQARLTLYPSPMSTMIAGMESMLQEPCGCFEQASSSNYPNVMVLQYMKEYNVADIALLQRIQGLLDRGYQKIAGYECSLKGFEWFGGNPGHEALTAYGLMEFKDMSGVYEKLDQTMAKRTADWLYARRDGKGGSLRNPQALDSFGGASQEITNAYITYALTEAEYKDITVELASLQKEAEKSNDPYLLALAANALFNAGKTDEAKKMAEKLAKTQQKDGSFQGTTHSITRSSGINLALETTALAALAFMKSDSYMAETIQAMEWLAKNRSGTGGFWATQSTVLSLKALTTYASKYKKAEAQGDITMTIASQEVSKRHFDKGENKPIEISDFTQHLQVGENAIRLALDSTIKLPYSMLVNYHAITPANDPDCAVTLETKLGTTKTKMGETVRLTATLQNRTNQGLPMTLVRIGLPGGLTFQLWQLKQLQEKKVYSFSETNPREIICYFRDLAPQAKIEIPVDLVANVPGNYTGPASCAYLYYTNDKKTWSEPLRIMIQD